MKTNYSPRFAATGPDGRCSGQHSTSQIFCFAVLLPELGRRLIRPTASRSRPRQNENARLDVIGRQEVFDFVPMLLTRAPLKFWLNVGATALLVVSSLWPPSPWRPPERSAKTDRPFGEPQSSEEPYEVELRRARERDRGREAIHPLQIPWRGWYDVVYLLRDAVGSPVVDFWRRFIFCPAGNLSGDYGPALGLWVAV